MAGVIGFSAALPYAAAAALLVLVYAILIWSDSSSLTAGSAGSAEPGRRGATLAVHSTLGYAGGFLGPLALGVTLDLRAAPPCSAGGSPSATSRSCCWPARWRSCGCAPQISAVTGKQSSPTRSQARRRAPDRLRKKVQMRGGDPRRTRGVLPVR